MNFEQELTKILEKTKMPEDKQELKELILKISNNIYLTHLLQIDYNKHNNDYDPL
jgi:hypothetical protein